MPANRGCTWSITSYFAHPLPNLPFLVLVPLMTLFPEHTKPRGYLWMRKIAQ